MTQKALRPQSIINQPDFDESFAWGRDYYQSELQDKGKITHAYITELLATELSPLAMQREKMACQYLKIAPASYEKHLGFVAGFLAGHAEAQTASPTSNEPVCTSHKVIPLRRS